MDASTPRPERLGQYEIVETLRLGSMWRTYKGFDPILRRSVALKAISKDLLSSHGPAGMARLQDEARAAISLKHPGIVRLFAYDEDADSAFVVMEYVEGQSLKERFQAPVDDAVALIVQLLDALDYAHGQGVIHRAIKPSNLLLTSQGQLRIADFGVARFDLGASSYMSPEQFIRAQVDRRSDVFSAGVVFYELLTGVNPFAGPPQDLINRVCNDKERLPSEVSPNVPVAFDPVCAKALAKIVSDRYMTARGFCDAIRGAFEAAFGSPPSTVISKETFVAGTSRAEVQSGSGLRPEPTAPSAAGSRWEDETLRDVEKQLAAFIGPLARVIVQKAASRTTDLGQLYSLAAQSLERDEERRAFLAGRVAAGRIPAPGKPLEESPQVPRPALPVKPSPSKRDLAPEPRPAPKPDLRSELKPAKPDPKSGAMPAAGAELKSSVAPDATSNLKSGPKAEPKIDVKPRPAPAESASDVAGRLEELLGKQPETLAGYMKDSPAQVEGAIHAFVATVEALAAMYAANSKIEALTPQNICFDRLGKATIRAGRPGTHGTGGVVSNPRYAAPEVFAEKPGADSTTAAADVYALGAMFYEILLGRTLFEKSFAGQQSDLDWLSWHADLEKKAPPLKSLLPDSPAALSDLLESMMEKRLDKRTTDLKAILQGLRSVAQRANKTVVLPRPTAPGGKIAPSRPPIAATPAKTPTATLSVPRKKVGGKRLVLLLLFLLALAVGGILMWQTPELYRELITRLRHLAQTP